jgi:hypothetical protein
MYVVPCSIVPLIRSARDKSVLIDLVHACQLCLATSISINNLAFINQALKQWLEYLTEEAKSKRVSDSVLTPNSHYLSHIRFIIERIGPLVVFSARSMERAIRKFKSRLQSSKSSHQTRASNLLIDLSFWRLNDWEKNTTSALDISVLSYIVNPSRTDSSLGGLGRDTVGRISIARLRNAMTTGLRKERLIRTINYLVSYGGTLWKEGTVFGSLLSHMDGMRAAYLVGVTLSIDKYARQPRREPEYVQKWFFGSNLFYVSFEDHTFALINFHEAVIEGDSNKSTVYVTALLMNKKIWIVW